jgi:hypothetical protein
MGIVTGLPRGPLQTDFRTGRVLNRLAAGKIFGAQSAGTVLAGPESGPPAPPTFRLLSLGDLGLSIGAPVTGSEPYQFLYIEEDLTLQQSDNSQYRGGWVVQKNNGPPVLADLQDGEWTHCFESGSAT